MGYFLEIDMQTPPPFSIHQKLVKTQKDVQCSKHGLKEFEAIFFWLEFSETYEKKIHQYRDNKNLILTKMQ